MNIRQQRLWDACGTCGLDILLTYKLQKNWESKREGGPQSYIEDLEGLRGEISHNRILSVSSDSFRFRVGEELYATARLDQRRANKSP